MIHENASRVRAPGVAVLTCVGACMALLSSGAHAQQAATPAEPAPAESAPAEPPADVEEAPPQAPSAEPLAEETTPAPPANDAPPEAERDAPSDVQPEAGAVVEPAPEKDGAASPETIPAEAPAVVPKPAVVTPVPVAVDEAGPVIDEEPVAALDDRIPILVMSPQSDSQISDVLSEGVTDAMSAGLASLGLFKPLSQSDIARLLAAEEERYALGCDVDASCLSDIGGAVGAEYVVVGSLARLDETYVLQLQLLNISTAEVQARESRDHQGGPAELFDIAAGAVQALVRDVLRQRAGHLYLTVSEEGAAVIVDDRTVGSTPMPPLELAGGVHHVVVEKDGYVAASRDVMINAKERTSLEVRLLPSADFRRAYEARNWTLASVSGALLVGGAGGWAVAAGLFVGGLWYAAGLSSEIDAYNRASLREDDKRQELQNDVRLLAVADIATVAHVAVGGALMAAGGITLLFVENPLRYAGEEGGAE